MSNILKPDLCIIGAGSGGLSVAAAAAQLGVSAVLIEKGAMGGDCLNAGCVPSKSVIAAAARAQTMREAGAFGVTGVDPQVNFGRLHGHVRSVIDGIAPTDSAERYRAMGVTVIGGEARFEDARTVRVGEQAIRARRFVIATGARPAIPDIAGLDEVAYHTNETIFDITRKPGHLAIIGAGAVGLELAQAYVRLGVAVTVIEAAEPLGGEDRELVSPVLDRLALEGVAFHIGARISRVAARKGGVRVFMKDHADESGERSVDATDLLIATGRRPVTDGLDLQQAGIAHDAGGISVDPYLRTTNRRVYAVGDVTGGPQFTHAASEHAGIVIRNAVFRLRARTDNRRVPRVVFTDPELAAIGLTEAEARESHRDIRVLRWPFAENDRARTEREEAGHIKVVATPKGRILGVGIVGAHAGELIQVWSLAMANGLGLRAMTRYVPPYPTLGEVSRRAAIEFYRPRLTRALVRRIIGTLRLFG